MKNTTTLLRNYLILIFLSANSLSAQSDLVITEIMYNSPGVDVEFLELYNNSTDNINLQGYTISNAVDYTFETFILPPTATVLVTNNAELFKSSYGFDAFQWDGALNNSGNEIVVRDMAGMIQDSVAYQQDGEWTTSADGNGSSLVLCDPSSDNNLGSNWQRAISPTGIFVEGIEVFANPNALSTCTENPIIGVRPIDQSIGEADEEIIFQFFIDNPTGIETSVDIDLMGSGTAENGTDFNFGPLPLVFDTSAQSTINIAITIIDDAIEEPEEFFAISLANETNSAIVLNDMVTGRIIDNDGQISNAMKIIGLVNGPISGSPKAVQLYVSEDIPNLSLFGLGCANNGGGTDGQEFTFPNMAIDKETCFWIANDTILFREYFGFSAQFQDRASTNFNGDDAFEIYENGQVIDVFGEVDEDGTDSAWEYAAGWARRTTGTGPDGSSFNIDNWEFSGIAALDGSSINEEAMIPYPVEEECNTSSIENVDLSAEISIYPNPASEVINVSSEVALEKIIITDLFGKELLITNNPDNYSRIDVSMLQNNLYIMSFVTKDMRWSQKITILAE